MSNHLIEPTTGIEYDLIDELYFPIMVREDLYNSLTKSNSVFEKFDNITLEIQRVTRDSLQKKFDEIFGEGLVLVE
jgi:hypothetical protein